MLRYSATGFASCCGLTIVHGLSAVGGGVTEDLVGGRAQVAVTNTGQEGAVTAQLERDGFQRVATFTGNYSNRLTLWLRQRGWRPAPELRTVGKKTGGWRSVNTNRRVTDAWAKKNPALVYRP
jgi:hypothetical protein